MEKRKLFGKKQLKKYSWLLSFSFIPLALTSCGVSSSLIKNSYLTKNYGDSFSTNLNLKQLAEHALKTNTGLSQYLSYNVNLILNDWINNLADNDSDYANLVSKQTKKINDNYDDLVDSYKDDYGKNWKLYFQQEVLDLNGGTKESYLENKLLEFAKETLSEKLFNNFYLSIYDNSTNAINYNPTSEIILSALKNTAKVANSNYVFKFDNLKDLTSSTKEIDEVEFANFQDFIFQKYIEYVNPYVINYTSFNYATPNTKNGLKDYYVIESESSDSESEDNSESEATEVSVTNNNLNNNILKTKTTLNADEVENEEDDTTTENESEASSNQTTNYLYPYFSNDNKTNTSNGTLTKFTNFVNNATNNNGYIIDTDLNLKAIPLSYSDDTTTLKLVNNNTIFNDDNISLSAAASYLYATTSFSDNSTQITDISNDITHILTTDVNASNNLDPITNNFVSNNFLYTNNSSNIKVLELDTSYLKKVINQSGYISSLSDNNVYVIDNFIADSSSNLDNYMFIRDNEGVKAITIAGDKLLNTSSDVASKKLNAGLIVIYYYFLGEYTNTDFTIDLATQVSSFFSSNFDKLVYEYANTTSWTGINNQILTNNMLTTSAINDENKLTLLNAISNYLLNSTYYDASYNASSNMYSAKKSYNLNYGYNVYNNGLASNFNYLYDTNNNNVNTYVSSAYLYENVLVANTSNNPYKNITTSVNANNQNNNINYYQTAIKAVANVINNLSLQKSTYNDYTQYINSDDNGINSVINNVITNSSFTNAILTSDIINNYLDDFYTIENDNNFNYFTLTSNPFKTANNNDDTTINQIQTYLANSLFNYYYLNNITNETNLFFSYGTTNNTINKQITNSSISKENLFAYGFDLWNLSNNNDYSSYVSNTYNINLLASYIKYLIGDDLSNFLKEMQQYVANTNMYVVWQNNYNTTLSSLNSNNTLLSSEDLIDVSDLNTNINNTTFGSYYGNYDNNANLLTYNLDTNSYYQTNLNNYYYVTTTSNSNTNNSLIGFMGLVTSNNNNLDTISSDAVFHKNENTNNYLTGSLANYKSKSNLINYINNTLTIDNLTLLADDLDSNTNYIYLFANAISNSSYSLANKKRILVDLVNSIDDSYFTKFSGYVGNLDSDSNTIYAYGNESNSVSKYGTYVIQLDTNSFSSISNLQNDLLANTNSYQFADEIICNLLVEYVINHANPSYWLPNIVNNNKISIYDVRAYETMVNNNPVIWVDNYKTISK